MSMVKFQMKITGSRKKENLLRQSLTPASGSGRKLGMSVLYLPFGITLAEPPASNRMARDLVTRRVPSGGIITLKELVSRSTL